jgi:hypothetical protein
MSTTWATILALAVGTAAIKGSGPAIVGGRELPATFTQVIALLAPALLAALIVTETFGAPHRSLTVDARAVGLITAAAVLAVRASLIGAVIAAAAATALVRALA